MKNKKILISSLLVLLFTGCTNVKLQDVISDNKYPEGIETYVKDWPKLKEEIKIVSYSDLYQKCAPHKPKGKEKGKIYGCSEIDLMKKTCTIFLTEKHEKWALEHEQQHCKGGDHDNLLKNYHEKWLNHTNQK